MTYLKNISLGLLVVSIFALHPSLNKGESPITYLQYLVYGNSLNISFDDNVDLDKLQIKWVCEFKNVVCNDLVIFEGGRQVNDIPFEKGSQKLIVYYNKNRLGEVFHTKIVQKQAHQYKVKLFTKSNSLFFSGEIVGPSSFKGPSVTLPFFASLQ